MSITEGGKEGNSKAVTSCKYLEERFQECSKKEEVLATKVETLGVDLRTRTKQLVAKEKARRRKCDVRFSLVFRNLVFQKNYMTTGCEEVVEDGFGSCESLVRTSRGHCAYRKPEVEEATSSSSRKEGVLIVVTLHGSE